MLNKIKEEFLQLLYLGIYLARGLVNGLQASLFDLSKTLAYYKECDITIVRIEPFDKSTHVVNTVEKMSDKCLSLAVVCVVFYFFIFETDLSMDLIKYLGLVWVNVLNRLQHESLGTGFETNNPQLLNRIFTLKVIFVEEFFTQGEDYLVQRVNKLLNFCLIFVEESLDVIVANV